MKIRKRNNSIVEFEMEKVTNAIYKACIEIDTSCDINFAKDVAEAVYSKCKAEPEPISVELIQDMIENELISVDVRIAKKYIIYRDNKNKNRVVKKKYKHLSEEFLSKYKHKPDPLSQLGSFVFYRTYSRYLPEENRREYWWETIARAVDHNCKLAPNTTAKEAELLYDNIYNLKQQLSGRSLFTGGTEASYKYPLSGFNCSFTTIESIEDFCDLFYVLMVGTGVGVGIQSVYTDKLPLFRTDINLFHEEWEFTAKPFREDITTTEVNGDTIKIIVGDSKEGFIEALRLFLSIMSSHSYRTIKNIIVNYNFVRPKGERLVVFGGQASGYESMKNMLIKIHKLIGKKALPTGEKVKLKSIDVMDISNIIGENVVSGGVRRTSEIMFIDLDDVETQNAKNDLYYQTETGEWVANTNILHRMMSNNSIMYEEKPLREQLHKHFEKMRFTGEPGIVVAPNARARRDNFKGLNPCFTGDMRLLTEHGYKTFKDLSGKNVRVVSYDGRISDGKVWSTGQKETVRVKFTNSEITCTPNHVFMTTDGREVEAKDLKGERVMRFSFNEPELDNELIKLGFIQGDGTLSRLNSDAHLGLEVNIGNKDGDIRELFKDDIKEDNNNRAVYITGYRDKLIELGFSQTTLPERVLPTTYKEWNILSKASFLNGCYSANGSIIKGARVAYKTTCKEFAEQLKETLEDDFGISAYITTNKPTLVTFANGTYLCKQSYDINISRFEDVKSFAEKIGFYHSYKKESLKQLILDKCPMVINVVPNGTEEVYDFNEPINHWGVVEGVVAHNCAEILLDSKGVCNLTTTNMIAFVVDGKLDLDGLLLATRLSARAGYRMTNLTLELDNWDRIQKRDRLLGVSMTGYQEMVSALSMTAEEEESLLETMRETVHTSMKEIAKELGGRESLLSTCVKPEGTLSQVFGGVSSGLHFPHSEYYIRRIRINSYDPLCKVAEELGWSVKLEVGQTVENCTTKVIELPVHSPAKRFKKDVTAIEQLEVYKRFQTHYTDHNSSITITVKNHEWEEVEEWIWNNWDVLIGVSFLSEDDSFYQLMPYEEINKEQYEELKARTKPFSPVLLKKFETTGVSELDLAESCVEDGACAVR